MGILNSKVQIPDFNKLILFDITESILPDTRFAHSDVFSQENERFTIFFDISNQVLYIYCCSAEQWHYDESFTFTITSFTTEKSFFFSTNATFSKKYPFCSIKIENFISKIYFYIELSGNYPYTRKDRFLGLRNSGSTCYMASVLQILYHTTSFRQLIYSFKNPSEAPSALQKLFTELQLSSRAPSLDSFIRTLGAVHELSAVQQDAHEFLVGLFERLETDLGEIFIKSKQQIFGGKIKKTINVFELNYKSEKIEEFFTLPVLVEGINSLNESLNLMIQPETFLDYNTDNGKGNAICNTLFIELPPILTFHLCRFQYSSTTNSIIEIKTNFECPFELDIKDYCINNINSETKYSLYGIIAHSGNPLFGHYTAFIRPGLNDNWIQFNDGTTKMVDIFTIQRLFGTSNQTQPSFFRTFTFSSAVAYMLFYVKNDSIEYINASENIPLHLAPHKSSFYFSRFIFYDQIKNSLLTLNNNPFEWQNSFETIFNICKKIDSTQNLENYFAWAQLPGKSLFIGPLNLNSFASQYVIKGHSTNFYILPSTFNSCPLFLVNEKPPKTIIDIILPQNLINSNYLGYDLKFQKRLIKNINISQLLPGSIIILSQIKTINLNINGYRYNFPYNSTYSDVQKRISLQNNIPPSQILILSSNLPLKPKNYPFIKLFPLNTTLNYQILDIGITVLSITLFTPLNLILISHSFIQKYPKPLWVKKNTKCLFIKEKIKKLFSDTIWNEKQILQISKGSIENSEKIYNLDDIIEPITYRIDMIRYIAPNTKNQFKNLIKLNLPFSIEVRFSKNNLLDNFYGTSRFLSIHKTTTVRDLIKKSFRMNGITSEQINLIYLFINEKPKIKIQIDLDILILPEINKFLLKLSKNNQRICIALIIEDPLINNNNQNLVQRSLSGLLNQK